MSWGTEGQLLADLVRSALATPTCNERAADGKIFTPFWTDPIAMKPGTMGGANWPPSSYDPETHLLYVCASERINSFSVQNELPQPSANQVYMGGRFTTGIQ